MKKYKLTAPSLNGGSIVYTFNEKGYLVGLYISCPEMDQKVHHWAFQNAPKNIEDVERLPLRDKKIEEM